jgi:hypothetical protein
VIIFEIYFTNNIKILHYITGRLSAFFMNTFAKIFISKIAVQNSICHYLYLQNDSVAQLLEHPDFIGRIQSDNIKKWIKQNDSVAQLVEQLTLNQRA